MSYSRYSGLSITPQFGFHSNHSAPVCHLPAPCLLAPSGPHSCPRSSGPVFMDSPPPTAATSDSRASFHPWDSLRVTVAEGGCLRTWWLVLLRQSTVLRCMSHGSFFMARFHWPVQSHFESWHILTKNRQHHNLKILVCLLFWPFLAFGREFSICRLVELSGNELQ